MRDIIVIKTEKNSLLYWYKFKNPLKVMLNFIVIDVCKILPSLSIKRFLFRLIGVKVGRDVSFGLNAQLDIFFPELIDIGDNSIIGYNTTILCHEFLVEEFRKGPVKIGKNVLIGANTTILPGIIIGNNSRISAMSLVNEDVEANSFVGGVPIRKIA